MYEILASEQSCYCISRGGAVLCPKKKKNRCSECKPCFYKIHIKGTKHIVKHSTFCTHCTNLLRDNCGFCSPPKPKDNNVDF